MARTPFADVSNFSGTVDPTAMDDMNAGWDVGSRWINTVSGEIFFAVDVSPGGAVWKLTTDASAIDFDKILTTIAAGVVITNSGNVVTRL